MKKSSTFEQAMMRLEEIAQKLNNSEAALDDSLKLFAEATELIAFCSTKLTDAKLQVETLQKAQKPAPAAQS